MNALASVLHDPLYRLVLIAGAGQLALLALTIFTVGALRVHRRRQEERRDATQAALRVPLFAYLAGEASLDETARAMSLHPLRSVGRALEKYAPMVQGASLDAVKRLYTASGLLESAHRMVASPFWWRRLEGMRVLGAAGAAVGTEELALGLRDPHRAVRLAAARGLGRVGDPRFVEALLSAIPSGRTSRAQIAEVLLSLGAGAHPRLRELVMDLARQEGTSMLRATTLEVLALAGDLEAGPYIRFALEDEDLEVRIAAYRAARLLSLDLRPYELRRGFRDPAWPVRAVAAQTAGAIREVGACGELARLLSDDEWWVRLNAANALRLMGREGTRVLEEIANHAADGFARDMALRMLTEDPSYGGLVLEEFARKMKEAA